MLDDPRMRMIWRNRTLMRWDDIGTERTGLNWFNRYMLYPWERPAEFELVR